MKILYKVGRALQISGMIILPIAMAGEVAGKLDLKQMLILAGLGIVVFFLGWLLQEAAKPK